MCLKVFSKKQKPSIIIVNDDLEQDFYQLCRKCKRFNRRCWSDFCSSYCEEQWNINIRATVQRRGKYYSL